MIWLTVTDFRGYPSKVFKGFDATMRCEGLKRWWRRVSSRLSWLGQESKDADQVQVEVGIGDFATYL